MAVDSMSNKNIYHTVTLMFDLGLIAKFQLANIFDEQSLNNELNANQV